MLARIKVNHPRVNRNLLLRIRAAHAIADVADSSHVLAEIRVGGRPIRHEFVVVKNRLARLASLRADASRRHHRHVTGVEVRTQVLNRHTGAFLSRIYLEGTVFFDDPPVVRDGGALRRYGA